MLARVQHAHLVAAVQNELRAGATAEADPLWRTDNRGFYEAEEEGPPPHIAPGAYAILAPLFVGFLVGPRCLVGMLAGGICSGAMVAVMMSNAGGAWDNSKKLCEKSPRMA